MLISFNFNNFHFVSKQNLITTKQLLLIKLTTLLGATLTIISNIFLGAILNILIIIISFFGSIWVIVFLFDISLFILSLKSFYSIILSVNVIWFSIIASLYNYNKNPDITDPLSVISVLFICWLFYHSDCILGLDRQFKLIFSLLVVIYCIVKGVILFVDPFEVSLCLSSNCLSLRNSYFTQVLSFGFNFSRKLYHYLFKDHTNSLFIYHPEIIITQESRIREQIHD